MDVRSRGFILCVILFVFVLLGCDRAINKKNVSATDWSSTISVSLAVATLDSPAPPPLDDTPEPDPDPAKYPCKGTGVITHGDGHKTPCPFHGEDSEPDKPDEPAEPHKCKCDTKRTYCNCKAAYGKCSCTARAVNTSTIQGPTRPSFLQRLLSPFAANPASCRQ